MYEKRGWKRSEVRRKSNQKNTHPSCKQLGNKVLCLLLPKIASSSNVATRTEVHTVVPTLWWNQQTRLCCMAMCLMSIRDRKIKSWDQNTLRKIQTWIGTPWLISVSVFDPTKILDLNFRGRFVSVQLGIQHTCTQTFACKLYCFCISFLFHHLLKLLPIFCQWSLMSFRCNRRKRGTL